MSENLCVILLGRDSTAPDRKNQHGRPPTSGKSINTRSALLRRRTTPCTTLQHLRCPRLARATNVFTLRRCLSEINPPLNTGRLSKTRKAKAKCTAMHNANLAKSSRTIHQALLLSASAFPNAPAEAFFIPFHLDEAIYAQFFFHTFKRDSISREDCSSL